MVLTIRHGKKEIFLLVNNYDTVSLVSLDVLKKSCNVLNRYYLMPLKSNT